MNGDSLSYALRKIFAELRDELLTKRQAFSQIIGLLQVEVTSFWASIGLVRNDDLDDVFHAFMIHFEKNILKRCEEDEVDWPYIRQASKNYAISYYRPKHKKNEIAYPFDDAVWSHSNDAGQQARATEQRTILNELLSHVSSDVKYMIYLHCVEELGRDEIGAIFGISGQAALYRINKGLASVRRKTSKVAVGKSGTP
jgi:RNA polymerase sigma factor (sigma-70 family)